MRSIGRPHIDSFNYMLEEGLSEAIKTLNPVYIELPNGDKVELKYVDVRIDSPRIPENTIGRQSTHKIYPSECRQRAATYKGKMTVKISWSINDKKQGVLERSLGEVPIMVQVIFFFCLFNLFCESSIKIVYKSLPGVTLKI